MIHLTVLLWGRRGVPGEFHAYEAKALDLFRAHGGEVVAAYRPQGAGTREDIPDEVQILRIADRTALERFVADPARTALAEEREAVIRRTEVLLEDIPAAYPPPAA